MDLCCIFLRFIFKFDITFFLNNFFSSGVDDSNQSLMYPLLYSAYYHNIMY